ncbi:MAG: sigma-54 dependent transcriptional regulator [Nitrospiraceae bacterium]|nr:sigma-54 dependent transcriptional regulator [Nitrospiraceae bacterium]
MADKRVKILVVEDERHMREILKMLLESEGYEVATAEDGTRGIQSIEKEIFNLVITDIKMPGTDGFGILKKALEVSPETVVIMITAFGTMESAIEAMKLGAYDYIHKPFKIDEIRLIIRKALEKQKLQRQISLLKQRTTVELGDIIARSARMKETLRILPRVAESRANVLITGESGTGKELIANAVHNLSDRKDGNFVAINCASLPEGLLESELFGYMRGAFTGASQNKQGLFEVADKGTLFLDEIGEMPTQLQSKLLRVIETGSFRRLGGTTDITVDVRLVSATNRDLKEAVSCGAFREDLFYRLNAIPVHLAPLRDRKDDIPALIEHFLKKKGYAKRFSREALDVLMKQPWRGNVRELENVLERAILFADGDVITGNDIPPEMIGNPAQKGSLPEIGNGIDLEPLLEGIEKDYLLKALEQTGGRKMEAAQVLGLTFRSFRHRLSKYGIK